MHIHTSHVSPKCEQLLFLGSGISLYFSVLFDIFITSIVFIMRDEKLYLCWQT